MQQEERFVWRRAPNVHVLAEHRELFGQVTVQPRELLKARFGEDALLEPALEGVRASTCQFDVEPVAARHQRVTDLAQLCQQGPVLALHTGGNLDHALRHLGRDRARKRLAAQQFQQVVCTAGKIVVVAVDELQLQFHAHGE